MAEAICCHRFAAIVKKNEACKINENRIVIFISNYFVLKCKILNILFTIAGVEVY